MTDKTLDPCGSVSTAELVDIIRAWEGGAKVQYLVLWGYDDEWTDYAGTTPPDRQDGRLAWRVSPNTGAQRAGTGPTGAQS